MVAAVSYHGQKRERVEGASDDAGALMEQRVDFTAVVQLLVWRRAGAPGAIAVTTKRIRPEYRRKSPTSSYFVPNIWRWGNVILLPGPTLGHYELALREIGSDLEVPR